MSDAKERLKAVLPHIMIAANMAQVEVPDGIVCLAVVAKKPDGSGKLTCTFEAGDFFQDILEVLGYQDLRELTAELTKKDEETDEG